MKDIICLLPLIPIRKEANHRSEMTSQLLFGEKASITNQVNEWIEIKTVFDGYKGWVELKSVEYYSPDSMIGEWYVNPFPIVTASKDNNDFFIPAGSEIPQTDLSGAFQINQSCFKLNTSKYQLFKPDVTNLTKTALRFLNAPYMWGGRSILGIDCSGLVQILYKIYGIDLPRDAKDQSETGTLVSSLAETIPGDLFFFSNEVGKIIHTGILYEPGKIIHSSGFVRIDKIDEKGIFNEQINSYTHNLKFIKRHPSIKTTLV